MIEWYSDKELEIAFDEKPCLGVRYVLPTQSEREKASIKKYPFICRRKLEVIIIDKKINKSYNFAIPKSYCWNGSDIPRIFWRLVGSKSEPQYLIGSCLHDFMLENKFIIDYNRRLTSLVFRGCLLEAGVSKLKANIMSEAVDLFQRFQKWWSNG